MATVTEILDRASTITGLRNTGTERTLATNAINDAYKKILMDTEIRQATATMTVTATADNYNVSAITGDANTLKIRHIFFSGGGNTYPLIHRSEAELLDLRTDNVTGGSPEFYSMLGTTMIRFWPTPNINDVLNTTYIPSPPTLVESGATGTQQTSPSNIPEQFHWDVILPQVVLQCLDRDQRLEDVGVWQQRYEAGISKMIQWKAIFGGDEPRIFLERDSSSFSNARDRYSRGL